jgi:DNA-directed RNA polymerase
LGRRAARERLDQWRADTAGVAALIETAQRDVEASSLFICYGHDSRLRRYPRVTSGPNPQGGGLGRALLMFDEGRPLGSRGLYWLAVRAATTYGLDKLNLDDRAKWTDQKLGMIHRSAMFPFECDFWWDGVDDPWGFLATCFEINIAMSMKSPWEFHSHIPVQVDGTCNGLQHLSAMGLDPVGALATNLTSSPFRHDIYEEVALEVNKRIIHDAQAGLAVAHVWLNNVDRSTVKRGVMTVPYGVTARGMADQLMADGMVPDDAEDSSAAAAYLRDVMWDSIGKVVVGARNIMDWLQTTAAALGKANIPFRWTTPTGSTLQQAYRPWVATRPRTAFGRLFVSTELDRSSLKVRKQALAASPNFVHSFDAAHMALTINAGAEQGITHWSTIHDSYGTHPDLMGVLNSTLRREFVRIYEDDWLSRVYEEVQGYGWNVEIAPPPERGTFDIQQVTQSPWFFA